MEDIRRQDRALFVRELLRVGHLILTFLGALFFGWVLGNFGLSWLIAGVGTPILIHLLSSWNRSAAARFRSKRYQALWNSVTDRLDRFEEVLDRMKKAKIADLQEMPKTIRMVAKSIYAALRRADLISYEVLETEKGVLNQSPVWQASGIDPQASELYRVADKNIADYRQLYASVMAGVQRAEAQTAVYMTTLDSLRMKMIGYRLVGKSPEMSSHDFLTAMAEAKLQLHAIDQALEELDFRQMPQMIAAIPPVPVADDQVHRSS